MQQLVIIFLITFGMSNGASASKVLIYPFGHCLNSHLLNAEKLANILSDHGHDVSMLVSSDYKGLDHKIYSTGNSSALNIEQVNLIQFDAPKNFFPVCNYDTVDFMLYSPMKRRFNILVNTFYRYCEHILKDKVTLQKIKNSKYDLFIMESLDPCSRILADYIDIPFIPFITTGLGHWDGNFRPPSYLPAAIAPFTPNMSFFQRMTNFLLKVLYEAIPIVMGFDEPFEDLKKQYSINTSLSIANTFRRAAIKLVNSNFAIEYPAPIEPDTILIGGFSVSQPQSLSPEFDDFIEDADNGIIVMSFGTLVTTFSEQWASIFVNAFKRLPQKVIWKYKLEDSTKPLNTSIFGNNIKVSRWIPQADLLAHPKTKLFITHCGLNGMYETAAFGVPVIAIPLSADQYNQAGKLTNHLKIGLQVDINTLTSDELLNTIKNVLGNPFYTANAKAVQSRFQDQPLATADTISYWLNYVVKHNGAKHLKSIARDLTWYQYFSIDVITFILVVTSVLAVFILKLFSIIVMRIILYYSKACLISKNKFD